MTQENNKEELKTKLIEAFKQEDEGLYKTLLHELNEDLYELHFGQSELCKAAYAGDLDRLRELINTGANINQQGIYQRGLEYTFPLNFVLCNLSNRRLGNNEAVCETNKRYRACADLLVEFGADLNARDMWGKTFKDYCSLEITEAQEFLLSHESKLIDDSSSQTSYCDELGNTW
ncbi:MAG TPA: hypothetical protein VM577_08795, partial [Anaerovoracaceae bacterium]|nr:hypothetical protein [Anaerovoracaceae bacterium]